MRKIFVGSALATAGLACMPLAVAKAVDPLEEQRPVPSRQRSNGQIGAMRKPLRARWKAQRRKLRPNRLHISKRARRRHRRARG